MYRKLFLTCFVLFIDVDEGSRKLLRLNAAAIVSALYLAILCLVRCHSRQRPREATSSSRNIKYISFP